MNKKIICLSCAEEMSESNPAVVHFKLENTVYIRDLKTAFVFSTGLLNQHGTNERVDTHKFQLDVISLIGNPFVTLQFFNRDGVKNVLGDGVRSRSSFLSSLVVCNILDFDHTWLLENPLAEWSGHFLISRLLVQLTTLEKTKQLSELISLDNYFISFICSIRLTPNFCTGELNASSEKK